MSAVLLAGALVLAAIFAVAGVTKLADREGSRAAAAGFGVPTRQTGLVALMLPLLELAIAAGLLVSAMRMWAAVSALALLAVFCGAIGLAMARGRAPDCHCFGQLHSAPAGWSTLARNGALAALTGFVVVEGRKDPGTGAFSWLEALEGIEWVVLALFVALVLLTMLGGLVVLHLLRSYGRARTRLDRAEERLQAAGLDLEEPDETPQLGLTPGTVAPPFALRSLHGERVGLEDLVRPGRPLLLVFTSPTCGQCSVLMPKVAKWQRDHAEDVTVALLSGGKPKLVRKETGNLEHVLLDKDLGVYEAYDVNGTPSAVLVADVGTIAAWTAAGGEWIEALFEQALAGLGRTPGLPVGSDVPAELASLVDGPTAVLFWNPDCGFCQSIEGDVRAWIEARPPGAPAPIVVSAGETEFACPVVPDPDWTLAGSLGADGTPMAVLLDSDGRIASPLASGGPDVLELLGVRELLAAG